MSEDSGFLKWQARCKCGWIKQLVKKPSAHGWATQHLKDHRGEPGYHDAHWVMVEKIKPEGGE